MTIAVAASGGVGAPLCVEPTPSFAEAFEAAMAQRAEANRADHRRFERREGLARGIAALRIHNTALKPAARAVIVGAGSPFPAALGAGWDR